MQFCNICAASQKMFCCQNLFQALPSECPSSLRLIDSNQNARAHFPCQYQSQMAEKTLASKLWFIQRSGNLGRETFLTLQQISIPCLSHLWLASLQDSEPRLSINPKFGLSLLAMWRALSLRFVVLLFRSVSPGLFLHYCPFLYSRSLLPPKASES